MGIKDMFCLKVDASLSPVDDLVLVILTTAT